jgi:hypothetical protein
MNIYLFYYCSKSFGFKKPAQNQDVTIILVLVNQVYSWALKCADLLLCCFDLWLDVVRLYQIFCLGSDLAQFGDFCTY